MRSGLLLLIVIGMMAVSVRSADAKRIDGVAATYQLILCKSACSFADPGSEFTQVILVLLDRKMTQERTR
jgi:hypothetical protein